MPGEGRDLTNAEESEAEQQAPVCEGGRRKAMGMSRLSPSILEKHTEGCPSFPLGVLPPKPPEDSEATRKSVARGQ